MFLTKPFQPTRKAYFNTLSVVINKVVEKVAGRNKEI